MSRRSARLKSSGGCGETAASTAIQVNESSLLSARRKRKPYQPPVDKDGIFAITPRHKCCHDRNGQAVNIEIVADKGKVVGQLQCLGDVVAGCPMFAGDWWTFERRDRGRGQVTVKLCRCCACHLLRGNPNLDYPRDRISSSTLLDGLKPTWEVIALPNGATVEAVGSTDLILRNIKSDDFNIVYAQFNDASGDPADPRDINDEIEKLRAGQALTSNFGRNGGLSSGFGRWKVLREKIDNECPIIARWLAEIEDVLKEENEFIRTGYFTSYEEEGSYLDWHADLNYFLSWYRHILTLCGHGGKVMFVINRHTSEWFGIKVPHGTEVIMSRRMGGPDDHGMMHVVPAGGCAKFIAIEYGNLKADVKGDTVFEHAEKGDEVMAEKQFLMVSGHENEENLLTEAEGVTHNLDDDGAETEKMPAS